MVASGCVAAEASTGDAVKAESSRIAVARQQFPHGVARRWRQSPSSMARSSPSMRARQSPSVVVPFLSKKRKLEQREADPLLFRRFRNASGLNRLGSMLADRSVRPHSLTLAELSEITNDFSDDRLLGEGAFGKVYKGVLPNGDMIAVKKLKWTMTGIQDKQYENEVRHLMRLKHPNIVQFVGYCSAIEKEPVMYNGKYVYAEKSERLLCLEYLPKGSLRDHLSDESSGLDWDTRYKIITGICYGLHYLHEEWQASTPIIHRDLKPANILLDDNMVPKIADFGLSRLFGEEQTRTTTKNCVGTLGYMAPEYLNLGIITKELDIFSLGVIIIQIVTGNKHYPYKDETSSEEFIKLVLKKWRNMLEKVQGYKYRDSDCQQIRRCIEVGLVCVKHDRAQRPTTRQIIKMLASGSVECSNKREMAINMLLELNPHGLNWNIRVCISRMWEFCDKDSGQIKHLDLVIVDEKNDAMYVEIPPEAISHLKNHLSEGKIVYIRRFLVQKAKSVYKVVEAPYMIKLSQRSIITPVIPEPQQFPKYTFNLIPFSEIKQHAGLTNRFLDVIGYVVAVSNIARVRFGHTKFQPKRTIILKNERGEQVEISLLGPRAIEFDGDKVYNEGQKTPINTIFVGTLAKNVGAQKALILSGSSACRWYTNEDIPAIHEFYARLLDIQGDENKTVERIHIHHDDEKMQNIEKKTLLQLKKKVDPVDHRNQLYECTVIITRLSPNQSWCYLACKLCHSKSYLQGPDYKCTSEECTCTQIEYRYKLCLMGSDDTHELEFVLFDKKAEQIIGKPVDKLLDIHDKNFIPPEISGLIGQKYTFVIKISAKRSFATPNNPSFDVQYITHQFGKQHLCQPFKNRNT